jgi:HPt (histidine-containing phosphotransfer) domain-containing protein
MEQPNLNYINQLAADSEEFKIKMISIIKKELPLEIAIYQKQLENNDYKLTAESVHKLKHKISILGLEKSYFIAEEFEDNLKEKSSTLKEEFENILNLMTTFVENL